jgi:predicted secreted protein
VKLTSISAIFFLFFAGSVFILLPFGVKTNEEAGIEHIPGQAESAPYAFNLQRHLLKSLLLAVVLFGLYYANWSYEWITLENLDLYS